MSEEIINPLSFLLVSRLLLRSLCQDHPLKLPFLSITFFFLLGCWWMNVLTLMMINGSQLFSIIFQQLVFINVHLMASLP